MLEIIASPGTMPTAVKATSTSAIDVEPGMPKNMVGISAPPSLALFDASGAITPRTSPLPKFSVFFSVWAAWA